MGDRHRGGESGNGAAKRAGRVTLHDQQARPVSQERRDNAGDISDMDVWIPAARASELDLVEGSQSVLGAAKRVLAGQDQARRQAATGQCDGYGRKLDRFWTGSDNEVDTRTMQPSP
jgi:hypothetical protein